MNPDWRTTTVVQLCQSIRESQDYSATLILADALQDAGCEDPKILDALLNGDQLEQERVVAMCYSEETAEAVRWMDAFVARFGPEMEWFPDEGDPSDGMSYHRLMEGAKSYIADPEGWDSGITQRSGQTWSGVLSRNLDTFWNNFEKITGTRVEDRHEFIGCAC